MPHTPILRPLKGVPQKNGGASVFCATVLARVLHGSFDRDSLAKASERLRGRHYVTFLKESSFVKPLPEPSLESSRSSREEARPLCAPLSRRLNQT